MRTRAQDDADYGDGAHLTVTVNVHVSARHDGRGHDLRRMRVGPRSSSAVTGHATDVTLFLRTPELRELRDLLTDTLTTLTDADTADTAAPIGADGESVTGQAA